MEESSKQVTDITGTFENLRRLSLAPYSFSLYQLSAIFFTLKKKFNFELGRMDWRVLLRNLTQINAKMVAETRKSFPDEFLAFRFKLFYEATSELERRGDGYYFKIDWLSLQQFVDSLRLQEKEFRKLTRQDFFGDRTFRNAVFPGGEASEPIPPFTIFQDEISIH